MAKAQKGELRQKRKGMGRDKDTGRARDKDTDTDTGCWHVPGLWESNGQTWGKGAAKHLQHTGTQPGQPSPCSSAFRLEQGSFVSSPFEPGVFQCPTLSRTASAGCLSSKAAGQSSLVTALSPEKQPAGHKGGIAALQEIGIKTNRRTAFREVLPS